jgi:hypothetical protein
MAAAATSAPTVVFSGGGERCGRNGNDQQGAVISVTITNGGGHVSPLTVVFTGGGGSA